MADRQHVWFHLLGDYYRRIRIFRNGTHMIIHFKEERVSVAATPSKIRCFTLFVDIKCCFLIVSAFATHINPACLCVPLHHVRAGSFFHVLNHLLPLFDDVLNHLLPLFQELAVIFLDKVFPRRHHPFLSVPLRKKTGSHQQRSMSGRRRSGRSVAARREVNAARRRGAVCCMDADDRPKPAVKDPDYFVRASRMLGAARRSAAPLPHVRRAKEVLYAANPCWLDSRQLWIEIQEQVARTYEAHNESMCASATPPSAPPVVYVIQHQHAVRLWAQIKRRRKLPMLPVLHVDSHPDMNPIHYPYRKCHEIGSVLPCALRERVTDRLAWVMPKWVQEHEEVGHWGGAMVHCSARRGGKCEKDAVEWENMCKRRKQYFLATDVPADDAAAEFHAHATTIDGVPGCAKGTSIPFEYTTVKPRASHQLASYLGPQYILDIDLDFFVTNGYDESDYREFDLPSTLRVLDGPTEQGSSRLFEDQPSMDVAKALRKEVAAIRRRVRTFAAFIRGLHERGSTPAIVSISDSAPVTFTAVYGSLNPFENCYCPRYFVPLLHDLLRAELPEFFARAVRE